MNEIKPADAVLPFRDTRTSHRGYGRQGLGPVQRTARVASRASACRPRPVAVDRCAEARAEAVVDKKSLDAIGWTFSTATIIVWIIAIALVRGAAL